MSHDEDLRRHAQSLADTLAAAKANFGGHPREKELLATADAVARARIPERIVELKRGEEPSDYAIADRDATPYITQLSLVQVGVFVSIQALAERPLDERQAALHWMDTLNTNEPAPRPEWLPGRDTLTASDRRNSEVREIGITHFRRIWHEEWEDPPVPEYAGETITDDQAALLDILEQVDEIGNRVTLIQRFIRTILGLDGPEQLVPPQDRADTSVDAAQPERSTT